MSSRPAANTLRLEPGSAQCSLAAPGGTEKKLHRALAQHLYPLLPSQLRISNGTGLQQESWASEALPLGWHQHYAGIISAAFLFHFIKQKAKAAALPGIFLA